MTKSRSSSIDTLADAWIKPAAVVELDAAGVVEKEGLVKDILGMQEGLRALLNRVADVQEEGNKLKSDNEMLQTYIDNLTKNNIAAGATK